MLKLFAWLFLVAACSPLAAAVYLLPEQGSRLIGQQAHYLVEKGDNVQQIALYHNIGLTALITANSSLSNSHLKAGNLLVIPKQMLLPYTDYKGIVVNLAEMRLYYFPPNEPLVYVFPVAIGRQGLSTPRTVSYIGDKRKDPVWRPTKSMRARYLAKYGKPLAKEIAPGPDNPFGKYALRLGTSEYLIHGSNKNADIGSRVSAGCLRMYDDDIEWLYHNVALGTQVRIVEQAIKMSYEPEKGKMIEVHQPLSTENIEQFITPAVEKFVAGDELALKQIKQLLNQPTGLVEKLKSNKLVTL